MLVTTKEAGVIRNVPGGMREKYAGERRNGEVAQAHTAGIGNRGRQRLPTGNGGRGVHLATSGAQPGAGEWCGGGQDNCFFSLPGLEKRGHEAPAD